MESSSALRRLSEVGLLAGLSEPALEQLATSSRVRRFPAGQVLFSEGDPGDSLIVLESGQLRVSRVSTAGQEAVLEIVDAPASLGELALLDGAPRDATVTVQRAVTVRIVPRAVFLQLLRTDPGFVERLLKSLARMVRTGNARHAVLLTLDVPGRLAKWLLQRGGANGLVELGRSQGELAAELATTRSTLNRALAELESLGYIAVDGDRVTLLDAAALERFFR
jgi:CRP-like cAMP-binding protein